MKVFILTRLYIDYSDKSKVDIQRDWFEKALKSVEKCKKGCQVNETILLLSDDTPSKNNDHKDWRNRILGALKKTRYSENDLLESDKTGSSHAMYRLRMKFIEIAGSDDIAITLDQDDELHKTAIRRIARRFAKRNADIVIVPFKVDGEKGLDLSGYRGRIHQRCCRSLSSCSLNNDLKEKLQTNFVIKTVLGCFKFQRRLSTKTSEKIPHDRLSRLCERFRCQYRQPYNFETLGWTKIYNQKTLKRYVDDLNDLFGTEEKAQEFFKRHAAYEDFVDYMICLYGETKICGCRRFTHFYNKHTESITSKPTLKAFRSDRSSMLLLLLNLFHYVKKNSKSPLVCNADRKLMRFIGIKTNQIEGIVEDYISDFKKGDTSKSEFANIPTGDIFTNSLTRLALGLKREETGLHAGVNMAECDMELFGQGDFRPETGGNLVSLLQCIKDVPEYRSLANTLSLPRSNKKEWDEDDLDNVRHALISVRLIEKGLAMKSAGRDARNAMKHERYHDFIQQKTPRNNQKCNSYTLFAAGTLIIAIATKLACCHQGTNFILQIQGKNFMLQMIGIASALWTAFATLVFNRIVSLTREIGEETILRRMYCAEFDDLIRHIVANAKVLWQIRRELEMHTYMKPAAVHMTNLKWPDKSLLMSEDMIKVISKDKLDEFNRILLNVRNINNSAIFLNTFLKSPDYTPEKMVLAIDWELARYFGYLANFEYFRNTGKFEFPQNEELDSFIDGPQFKNNASSIFMSANLYDRKTWLQYYLQMYKSDRRIIRKTIEM